jgi:hypothetical protein
MADAEDLKSSGDFSSCGFDSHPGHHFLIRLREFVIIPGCQSLLQSRKSYSGPRLRSISANPAMAIRRETLSAARLSAFQMSAADAH